MKKIISSLLISISIASCGFSPVTSSVPTIDKSGSYVFNVGHKQTGATISAKVNLSKMFKTKAADANVDGTPEKKLSDIRYVSVYLLALDPSYAGTDPLTDTAAIPNISAPLTFSYNYDLGSEFGVKFTNVGETPVGKNYYIGVVIKDSTNAVISKDGGIWTGSSLDSGLSLSSNSVAVSNSLVVSDLNPLLVSSSLKDVVGAEVASNIMPEDGLMQSYSSDMLGFNTVAGGGVDAFGPSNVIATNNALTSNIRGVAADSLGNVYFADETNGYIAMVNKSGILTVVATGLDTPVGLAVNEHGDIFVAENGATKKVTKFVKQSLGVYTKTSYNITSSSDISGGVYSIAFSKVNPNVLYVGTLPTITKLDMSTNTFSDLIVNFGDTAGIGVDSNDVLYISDFASGTTGAGKLIKYNPSTNTTENIVVGLTKPDGVVVDYTGNVYVALDGDKIFKYSPLVPSFSLFAGGGTLPSNTNGAPKEQAQIGSIEMLAIESGNNLSGDPTLYYVDSSSQLIRKIVP